jgi:hypothetical protein
MNIPQLSEQGNELAYSTIAFQAGKSAAWKALGDINREAKAATERTNDAHSELENDERGSVEMASSTRQDAREATDNGGEPTVTFAQYCGLFAAANDYLVTLANGKQWPRPTPVSAIIRSLQNQRAQEAKSDAVEETRAMISAYTGGRTVSYEEAKLLADGEAREKAEYFNGQFTEHGDEVADRILTAVSLWDRNIDNEGASSVDTVLSNMPQRIQLSMLNGIDRKIDYKCTELLTGMAFGKAAASAKIPKLVRGAMIAELRADQALLKTAIERMAHAQDPVTA